MNDKLRGIVVPAVTPFDESDDLRLDWLEHNLEQWGGTAVRGVMVLGTNGEFRSLDDDEARAVIARRHGHTGDKTLIVGVGRESTRTTVNFIDSIGEHAGAVDYVSVLPPHYFAKQMTGDALLAHYTEVADRSPIPVLLYVAPAYSNGVVVAARRRREARRPPQHRGHQGHLDGQADGVHAGGGRPRRLLDPRRHDEHDHDGPAVRQPGRRGLRGQLLPRRLRRGRAAVLRRTHRGGPRAATRSCIG